ncbi:DEAD/DEAH box helicase [Longimicrobium sp.]|uniref:DEAD/DEAH box helicase n=1 Tax=Longimicrobium sp. TaxID=2029185 RepID=UPI002BF9A87F|nr:DEAD/DEAH box helicase [Longimicrobium sp.]HSU14916.1 DEAD/DEAH box helicase [Longimicrobium sp.]
MSFDTLSLHPSLLRAVHDLEFTKPTPIQQQAIPPALEGRDLLACAMTGSGKTAAFLLPIMNHLIGKPRGTTRALVISPTRELAAQIHEHFTLLAKHTNLRAAAVFGGVGMSPQEQAFRRGVDLIVATPGRLLDHLQHPYAKLDKIEVLVLDEADRMLDMGFLPDIRRVLRQIPTDRQTLFFSATMPDPIVKLSHEMLRNPAAINIERKAAPATGITQAVYPVKEDLKPALLLEMLRRGEVSQAIVFCRTKHRSNRLFEILEKAGIPVARIHGNRSQSARTDALAGFKGGKYRILVATDIVARGIDVEALEHVVNFDVPHMPEDYIHRVGRTARADAIGEAYTLVSPEEERDLKAIERAVGKALKRVTVAGFDYNARAAERFEVPIGERIKEIRARKATERERARQKADAKAQREADEAARLSGRGSRPAQPAPRRQGDDPRRDSFARGDGGSQPRQQEGGGSGSRRRRGRGGRRPAMQG